MSISKDYVLLLQCPDRAGIVAAIMGYIANAGGSITESSQFNDAMTDRFYMRAAFRINLSGSTGLAALEAGFAKIAKQFDMSWALHDVHAKPRTVIAVSRFGHCLYDLMHRWLSGVLPMEIVGVISNHEDMRSFVDWAGVPYFHLPVDKTKKEEQQRAFLETVEQLQAEFVVLARYMQILSPEMCERLAGRCINIHHSFLPSFKGAKPYHQAHARGVKIIGATAHYVTTALDEGPIIEQDVVRIRHSHTPEALAEIGKDIERRVLARAVQWHVQHRVILNGNRTIVFD
jgi:formyltetrahydrofolate deformylase